MGLDVDEFVVLHPEKTGTTSLATFLEDYESYGGVAVQWKVYGSDGHVARPRGGMLRNYARCMRDNTRHKDGYGIKTIARAAAAARWTTAHSVEYYDADVYSVDPDKKRHQRSVVMKV